eukprot:GHRQ01027465.1.p2 GENE.GHRQ01027465.1~~GHRQ01027465.1.p2  ORF type:complete len:118 (+),score=28.07 GHRQ01027465.1:34-354(+)
MVAFNFTGFMDYESGISRYQWGIGSSQFAADVVPLTNVIGERLLKDIRYSGGTKKMFVTPVVSVCIALQACDLQLELWHALLLCFAGGTADVGRLSTRAGLDACVV